MTIIAVMRARRCARRARYGAHAAANCCTDAGADQAAAQRSLGGIVRVREGRARQQKPGAD